ncbi:unnamed protein product [Aspergillus oryzae RIB40]|uniref:DNA, SC103 n=2 Tax=Aspergillus oryzae TaxID=5062 RepID=Q2TXY0_ASPOR|nr:unnamed protein product [Aspergillus oryzae RIB40]EIT83258.1 hypothetical protein Ao3042_11491 [Aspergillus oryzae 3.042]KDE79021.1 hypothetical protein AO1008_05202 [Aspergillus oryzae 100-8]BAE65893.1 unnamed protein product [Aspergillus oryzae RIB40]|eukprot:EIT83258.1 hypothetical protein Ao3042_11491 [Aspergillus oryzae 3.042]
MLIHRPALTFGQQEPQFADSLRACKEATTHLILAFELASDASFVPGIWPSGHHLIFQSGLMLLYDRWFQNPIQSPGISSEPDTLPKFIHIAITLLSRSAAYLDERVGSGRPRSPSTTDTIESLRQTSSYLHYLSQWRPHGKPNTSGYSNNRRQSFISWTSATDTTSRLLFLPMGAIVYRGDQSNEDIRAY